ncbi:MAG: GYD domain-containing protein [Candidatus Latescibacteria bacterium]|jgi:uncharacterized protein with GYD domain|nr:GYD domain-containing protein [Candidatus Latescibacterota bacterium]MBT4137000.1 GYD domain-containing protein [Candidatus Latescibacterota bacterium]MBT5832569.1 GYD domain-containing protein [Candidatus Latescibacterota bacterium]
MPKYLIEGSYSAEGLLGLVKEGGGARRDAVAQLVQGLGGTLEVFYYTFGREDTVAIADLPDNVTATAISIAANASGAVRVSITVLLTPEEIDAATKKTNYYRAPGEPI